MIWLCDQIMILSQFTLARYIATKVRLGPVFELLTIQTFPFQLGSLSVSLVRLEMLPTLFSWSASWVLFVLLNSLCSICMVEEPAMCYYVQLNLLYSVCKVFLVCKVEALISDSLVLICNMFWTPIHLSEFFFLSVRCKMFIHNCALHSCVSTVSTVIWKVQCV